MEQGSVSQTVSQAVPLFSGIVSGQYPLEESGGPLSQMSEAVNNIDRPKTSSDDMHAGAGHMNLKVRM